MPSNPVLHRGINLAAWLAEPKRRTIYEWDARQLKAAGFDFVRLPVGPETFGFNIEGTDDVARSMDFGKVDKAVEMLEANGLDVVLDIHPASEFMDKLEQGGIYEDRFAAFWSAIASHYKVQSAQKLAYEILNEPQYYHHADRYNLLARRVLLGIRRIDPTRLVIIQPSATLDGSPSMLVSYLNNLGEVSDPNLAYDVHFYRPYIVTHQGAVWFGNDSPIGYFSHVPYPARLVDKNKVALGPGANPASAKKELDQYVGDGWDRARIDSYIEPAAEWASQHHARLLMLEFGVLRTKIDPDSRYRWISDTRGVLDAHRIGWAVFDYADIFGIVRMLGQTNPMGLDGAVTFVNPEKGTYTIEPEAIEALGLLPQTQTK